MRAPTTTRLIGLGGITFFALCAYSAWRAPPEGGDRWWVLALLLLFAALGAYLVLGSLTYYDVTATGVRAGAPYSSGREARWDDITMVRWEERIGCLAIETNRDVKIRVPATWSGIAALADAVRWRAPERSIADEGTRLWLSYTAQSSVDDD